MSTHRNVPEDQAATAGLVTDPASRPGAVGEPGTAYYRYHIFPRDALLGRDPTSA
jgi:hypothetical protein